MLYPYLLILFPHLYIIAPSRDIIKKRRLYEKNKVKHYWIVDTQEKEIYIYKLQDNGKYGDPEEYTKSDKIKVEGFEGLEIDLSLVFRTGVKENPEKI
ncbi:MAG: Uma2 family endonuclease [Candidatus Eremiobacterota bacterium]